MPINQARPCTAPVTKKSFRKYLYLSFESMIKKKELTVIVTSYRRNLTKNSRNREAKVN